MIIPKKITIAGAEWEIINDKELDGKSGTCVFKEQKIYLCCENTQTINEQTLIHELLHIICYPLKEELVEMMSQLLHQAFIQIENKTVKTKKGGNV